MTGTDGGAPPLTPASPGASRPIAGTAITLPQGLEPGGPEGADRRRAIEAGERDVPAASFRLTSIGP